MNGKMLRRAMLDFLDEENVDALYASTRRVWESLDHAASIFCRETGYLKKSVQITTIAAAQTYDLPPDYIRPAMQNRQGRYIAKYTDSDGNVFFPILSSHERIYKANLTDSQDSPYRFAIRDKQSVSDALYGIATATADPATGDTVTALVDSTATFSSDSVRARDTVHNVTDQSDGMVISVATESTVWTAVFEGTTNAWDVGDSYVIQPAAEFELVLDAPSESSGDVFELYYVCMPEPVYHDLGMWRFPQRVCRAIAQGAASLFKGVKREYKDASSLGGLFSAEVSAFRREIAANRLQQGDYRKRR